MSIISIPRAGRWRSAPYSAPANAGWPSRSTGSSRVTSIPASGLQFTLFSSFIRLHKIHHRSYRQPEDDRRPLANGSLFHRRTNPSSFRKTDAVRTWRVRTSAKSSPVAARPVQLSTPIRISSSYTRCCSKALLKSPASLSPRHLSLSTKLKRLPDTSTQLAFPELTAYLISFSVTASFAYLYH
jgi:hypothetical protein